MGEGILGPLRRRLLIGLAVGGALLLAASLPAEADSIREGAAEASAQLDFSVVDMAGNPAGSVAINEPFHASLFEEGQGSNEHVLGMEEGDELVSFVKAIWFFKSDATTGPTGNTGSILSQYGQEGGREGSFVIEVAVGEIFEGTGC